MTNILARRVEVSGLNPCTPLITGDSFLDSWLPLCPRLGSLTLCAQSLLGHPVGITWQATTSSSLSPTDRTHFSAISCSYLFYCVNTNGQDREVNSLISELLQGHKYSKNTEILIVAKMNVITLKDLLTVHWGLPGRRDNTCCREIDPEAFLLGESFSSVFRGTGVKWVTVEERLTCRESYGIWLHFQLGEKTPQRRPGPPFTRTFYYFLERGR